MDVFTAPPVVGAAGGNGYNLLADLLIDGGWNLKNHVGDGNGNWHYDPTRMTQRGVLPDAGRWSRGLGLSRGQFRRALPGRERHLYQYRRLWVPYGRARREFCARRRDPQDRQIRLCIVSPDCFVNDVTCYLTGDGRVEIRAGAGNLRWSNSKVWFCGMQRAAEPIGAGVWRQ